MRRWRIGERLRELLRVKNLKFIRRFYSLVAKFPMHNSNSTDGFQTTRMTVPALEGILGRKFPVLDHGFVRVIDYMGGDAAIVQAARVSYGKGTKKTSQDRGLIRYLMHHRHTTPFEMCEIKFHIKLPIFVARQWIRHRTANVNEYSARYSILDKEFYVPDRGYIDAVLAKEREERRLSKSTNHGQQQMLLDTVFEAPTLEATAAQSVTNKQGRGEVLDEDEACEALKAISRLSGTAYTTYMKLLNEDDAHGKFDPRRTGIARELARIVLPTNYYTQWYWKIDLHNLFHFISLRADSHAQYEIQEYARAISDIVKAWVPMSYEAFVDYKQGAQTLSRLEIQIIKKILNGEKVTQESSGLSAREWKEFAARFELEPKT
jgi:thymidylate synthase (FAD)